GGLSKAENVIAATNFFQTIEQGRMNDAQLAKDKAELQMKFASQMINASGQFVKEKQHDEVEAREEREAEERRKRHAEVEAREEREAEDRKKQHEEKEARKKREFEEANRLRRNEMEAREFESAIKVACDRGEDLKSKTWTSSSAMTYAVLALCFQQKTAETWHSMAESCSPSQTSLLVQWAESWVGSWASAFAMVNSECIFNAAVVAGATGCVLVSSVWMPRRVQNVTPAVLIVAAGIGGYAAIENEASYVLAAVCAGPALVWMAFRSTVERVMISERDGADGVNRASKVLDKVVLFIWLIQASCFALFMYSHWPFGSMAA
ncbi:MAG: hypothetical protein SGILL_005223, partial [Bacillariaceae sp.]